MTSLWLDRDERIDTDSFPLGADATPDTVVVGGGLTGLCIALLLARSGEKIVLAEARYLGAVTTGNTTGKLSLLHGGQLSHLLGHNSPEVARAYVEANLEGQQWLLRYCAEHGLPVQTRDAFTYATTQGGADQLNKELDACHTAGLNATLETDTELPFPTFGALRLAAQAQINPIDIVRELARDLRGHGGRIVEQALVTDAAEAGDRITVTTARGELHARRVVLATGTPVLGRGTYFARLTPLRSYAMAFAVPGAIPQGMYLSIDEPARSLRTAPSDDGERLVVGGNGHIVGREHSPAAQVHDLEAWTTSHFPGAQRTHSWSAQDYRSLDYAPYVGPITPGDERIFVATGFNKWGMTNAIAASLALSGRMLDGDMAWATTLYERPLTLADAGDAIALNVGVGIELAKDWLGQSLSHAPEHPPAEGQGAVYREGMSPVGVCTVGGVQTKVSGICTHLGGVLGWNDAEQSWDCPLHGSRFSHDGTRLEGPALHDLDRVGGSESVPASGVRAGE